MPHLLFCQFRHWGSACLF